MKIAGFGAHDAFSFADVAFTVSDSFTLITGPNASGKTNLGRVVEIVRLALDGCRGGNLAALETRFGQAGRHGETRWTVYLDVTFDREDQRLIDEWLRAAMQSSLMATQDDTYRRRLRLLQTMPDAGTEDLFNVGRLVVAHSPDRRNPWHVSWQTDVAVANGDRTKVVLRIDTNQLAAESLLGEPAIGWEGMIDAAIGEGQSGGTVDARANTGEDSELPSVVHMALRWPVPLAARWTGHDPEPPAVRALMDWLNQTHMSNRVIGFADVAARILEDSVFVTANQRAPITSDWSAGFMSERPDLATGAGIALALYKDKNGDRRERTRFSRAQDLFRRLTSDALTLNVTARDISTDVGAHTTILTPVVDDGRGDIPLEMSGAGRGEAAHLAAVLARHWDSLILDEPATNLSASAQHQLLDVLRERSAANLQTILITHSGHLVPADEMGGVVSLTRLIRCDQDHTHVYQLEADQLRRASRLMRPVDVRDVLFSDGVLLVEGATDHELLRIWLADVEPTPQASNIVLLRVDGHGSFVPYMRLLDALGVNWAGLADGPAFKTQLPKYDAGAPSDDFPVAKAYWAATHHVYTLADGFGTEGPQRRAGEIERFLEQNNPHAFAEARRQGGRSKPAVAAAYAAAMQMPDELAAIWRKVVDALRGHR